MSTQPTAAVTYINENETVKQGLTDYIRNKTKTYTHREIHKMFKPQPINHKTKQLVKPVSLVISFRTFCHVAVRCLVLSLWCVFYMSENNDFNRIGTKSEHLMQMRKRKSCMWKKKPSSSQNGSIFVFDMHINEIHLFEYVYGNGYG